MAPSSTEAPPGIRVSLVVETETDEAGHGIRLTDVLEAWKNQTAAPWIGEWIIVASRPPSPPEQRTLAGLPQRWLLAPGLRYHQNKNAGMAASRGAYVVLTDSDVVPEPDWLEKAVVALESSGDRTAVVTGKSAYAPGPFSRELALAQWPNHGPRTAAASHFLAHNILLRGEVARRYAFPESEAALRHGPDTALAERLRAEGWTLLYDPALRMTHNAAASLRQVWRHCVAHGQTEARFLRARGTAPAGTLREAAGRIRVLWRRLVLQGRDVGIGPARLPLSFSFYAAFAAMLAVGRVRAGSGHPEVREPF